MIENGIVGILLVLFFLALFLNLRLAIWVAFGLPVAFLGMFMFAAQFNVTINVLSLFGMIIVIGILVDSVAEVVYLRQSEIETAPNVGNDESAKFIQGVCHKNDELLILIELDKLLTDTEWAEIEEI